MTVRICYPALNDFVRLDGQRLVGPFAMIGRLVMEQTRGLNTSVVRQTTIGGLKDTETMAYDGCIGSMQRNESDFQVMPMMKVPVFGPNLTHGIVDGFERMGIGSCYHRSEHPIESHTHVLDMVYAFSADLWILTAFSFLILAVSIFLSLKVNHKKRRICYKRMFDALEACLLKQHSGCMSLMPEIVSCLFFYTLMSMLAYYVVGFYLTSMIKTEMVVVEPPVTVESYDELISSGRRPFWIHIMADWESFRFAKHGTKEKKIWDIAVRMGLNQSFMQSDMASSFRMSVSIANLESVGLVKDVVGKYVFKQGCAVSRSRGILTQAFPLFRFDESAKESLHGHVYNHLMDEKTAKYISRRHQLTFEAGLKDASLRFIDGSQLLGRDLYAKHSAIEECSSNLVFVPHPEFTAVDPLHYHSLLWTTLVLLYIAILVLLFELYYKH